MYDRPSYPCGCWRTFRSPPRLFEELLDTPWVRMRRRSCRLVPTTPVRFGERRELNYKLCIWTPHSELLCLSSFNRPSCTASLWIFTFSQISPRERREMEAEICKPPTCIPWGQFPPQLNNGPLVAEWLIPINGEGETFNFACIHHQHWRVQGVSRSFVCLTKDIHEITIAVISQHNPYLWLSRTQTCSPMGAKPSAGSPHFLSLAPFLSL